MGIEVIKVIQDMNKLFIACVLLSNTRQQQKIRAKWGQCHDKIAQKKGHLLKYQQHILMYPQLRALKSACGVRIIYLLTYARQQPSPREEILWRAKIAKRKQESKKQQPAQQIFGTDSTKVKRNYLYIYKLRYVHGHPQVYSKICTTNFFLSQRCH